MATLDFPKMIHDAKKSLDQYYEGFDRVLASQKKTAKDFSTLQKKITESIAIEQCQEIKAALQSLRDSIEAINDARDKAITSRMQNTVLEKLNESRSLTVMPMVKLLSTVQKDKSKWLDKKKQNASDTEERKLKYKEEAAEFYESIVEFERCRTKEIQTTLKEFCNSQLYYHCQAVESWSGALQKISSLNLDGWYQKVASDVSNVMDKENLIGGRVFTKERGVFDNEDD